MKSLELKLVFHPVLTVPYAEWRMARNIGVCDVQVGCALLRERPDKKTEEMGYWLRSLSSAERSYDTTEREFSAILFAKLLLWPYLEGTPLTIRTDEDRNNHIFILSDAFGGRLVRRGLRLFKFYYDVFHGSGVNHGAYSAFSRLLKVRMGKG